MFGLLVKVVGSSAIDPGLIPGNLQLGQESGIVQEIANSAIFYFFKVEISMQVLIESTMT